MKTPEEWRDVFIHSANQRMVVIIARIQQDAIESVNGKNSETPLERFERLAERFHRETGLMAPGKDMPAAMGPVDHDERMSSWVDWLGRLYP